MARSVISNPIYVNSKHPLSRLFEFDPPLKIACDKVTVRLPSIEHIRCYLSLRQSGFLDAASAFRQASCSSDLCSNWVETRGCRIDGLWIVHAKELFQSILVDQLGQHDSPFREAWDSTVSTVSDGQPTFVVVSGEKENVWSCGLGISAASKTPRERWHGRNLFGQLLSEIAREAPIPRWTVKNLLQFRIQDHDLWSFPKTLLVLSDSTFRQLKHIEGGSAFSIPGGKYSDLLQAADHDLLKAYGVVILNAGVNVARHSHRIWQHEYEQLHLLIARIGQLQPKPKIIVCGPMPLPGAKNVVEFNKFLTKSLRIDVIKFGVQFIDWTSSAPPFDLDSDGQPNLRYIDKDKFHLSQNGTWMAIKRLKREYPLLERISFSVSTAKYVVDVRPLMRHPPFAGTRSGSPARDDKAE